jgi:alkylation response protein AidB-like acyl-CoA dehydrogenase
VTNGVIADVVVVMAVVPKSERSRGGITAFICPMATDGITVTHRNEFMGLRGIENAVIEFADCSCPRRT